MELTEAMAALLQKTADAFPGAQRRRYMAEAVEAFDLSQRQAERHLGWAHDTVRKALHEFHSGITCVDNFSARGRKPCEFHLPQLSQDIRDLVADLLQTDHPFQTPLLDLSAGFQGAELVLYPLEGDQRLHRGSVGAVVARETTALPEGRHVVAGPRQRTGEPQSPQSVPLSASAVRAGDPTDDRAGV